jgi:hypothetical protein
MKKQIKSLQKGIVLLESKKDRNFTLKEHELLFELHAVLDRMKRSRWQKILWFLARLLQLIATVALALIQMRD